MRCEDARAAYFSGDASSEHRDHLATCAECLSISDELSSFRSAIRDEAIWEEPGADLEDRLVTLISGAPEARSARGRPLWWISAAATLVVAAGITAALVALRPGAPDWEVALPGTAAAPAADGVVQGWNESGGTRLRFEIEGLDAAPGDSFYEVWFSRGAIHISAGTFTSGGTIDMWTGISRRDFPRIWITLEPIDTDEGPSTITVMDTG